jgi:hypothetical protein
MPRASFGDKCTVAVQRKSKQSVFDCSSKVLDVLTLDTTANGDAHTLLILCEEGVCMSVCTRTRVHRTDRHRSTVARLVATSAAVFVCTAHITD